MVEIKIKSEVGLYDDLEILNHDKNVRQAKL